jgi:hypothetical protein
VLQACQEFGATWKGKIVRAGVDNAGVVYMINSGNAAAPDCAELLRQIADLEAQFDFTLIASWVPREFNVAADTASRDKRALAQAQLREEGVGSLEKALSPPSYHAVSPGKQSHTWKSWSGMCSTALSA